MITPPANVVAALTDGGIPRPVSVASLCWLYQQHVALAAKGTAERAAWHRRQAATIEEIVATRVKLGS